ncbi:hypothetical protein TWF694_000908 [Orbilia ellipsospora]|uniref:Uncharacterized protein n=1 Tax=Orbilia ellipsospora TaxID=2528407 RepID=A0AAV9XQ25_9PEZI
MPPIKKLKTDKSSKDNSSVRPSTNPAGRTPACPHFQTRQGSLEPQGASSRRSAEPDPSTSDGKKSSTGIKKSGGSIKLPAFKWLSFDGAGDETRPSGSSQPGSKSGKAKASSSSTESSSSDDHPSTPPQPPRAPPHRPLTVTYPIVAENNQVILGVNQAAAVEDPDAITPAPPLLPEIDLDNEPNIEAGTSGRPIFGSNDRPRIGSRPILGPSPGSRIPINITDQPALNAHHHEMKFDKCGHLSGNHVECEETNPAACKYNADLTLRGFCQDCDGDTSVRTSLRRFGTWVSRTARSITRRGRIPVTGIFDQGGSGAAGSSSAAGGGGVGGGGGDGQGSRPLSRHAAQEEERQRRRSARGQTGSSVGAGGFDPTIQDDTESDKS